MSTRLNCNYHSSITFRNHLCNNLNVNIYISYVRIKYNFNIGGIYDYSITRRQHHVLCFASDVLCIFTEEQQTTLPDDSLFLLLNTARIFLCQNFERFQSMPVHILPHLQHCLQILSQLLYLCLCICNAVALHAHVELNLGLCTGRSCTAPVVVR